MKLYSSLSLVVLVLVVALVVPTGALLTDGGDDKVWEENGVILRPAPGPNGEYAKINSDTNLSIDITDPGVNLNATTTINGIFIIENTGDRPARVWLTHNDTTALNTSKDVVTLTDSTRGTALEGRRNNQVLASGEQLLVGLHVDTTNATLAPRDQVLNAIRLHVRLPDQQPTTPTTPTTTTTAPTTTVTTPATTTEPTTTTPPTTPTPPAENESVDVDFGTAEQPVNVTTEAIQPADISEPTDTGDAGPMAVINAEDDADPETSAGRDKIRVNNTTVSAVTNVGNPVELEGDQSFLDSSDAIDRRRRIISAVQINVPRGYERRAATVQLRVPRSKLGDTAPENARIGHRTAQGWQLLDTRVVARAADSVVLQARTPGFSVFAVFGAPSVTYKWTLPDGTTHVGPEIRSEFDDPGIYNVTLTVIDAYGRSNSTQYEILVNDNPSVQITGASSVGVNESLSLQANVSNTFGNTTVTWYLPGGRQTTGATASVSLPRGVYTIEVQVADEFGATTSTTHTVYVGIGPGEAALRQLIFGQQTPLIPLLGIFLVLTGILAIIRRWGVPTPRIPMPAIRWPWQRSKPPRITTFDNPHWDPRRGTFEIDALEVSDPDNDLALIEISILHADGELLARKTIDMRQTDRYHASPATISGARIPEDANRYIAKVRAIDENENEQSASKHISDLLFGNLVGSDPVISS